MAKKFPSHTRENEQAPEEVSADALEVTAEEAEAMTDQELEVQMDAQLEMELESSEQEIFQTEAFDNDVRNAPKANAKAESEEEPEIDDISFDEATFDQPSGKKSADHEEPAPKKVQIEFPYSELIREKVPKVFEVAETVAQEWVNDGNFENVPVGHPLAQITVAAGLRKAKEIEKQLEEKGVFAMAKMGLEFAKSQINEKLKKR